MLVPKAAVYENHLFLAGEDDVRGAREAPIVKTKPVSQEILSAMINQ
jgi:hypothetical protein